MLARSYGRSKIASLKKRQSNTNIAASFCIQTKTLEGMRKFWKLFFSLFQNNLTKAHIGSGNKRDFFAHADTIP